MRIIRTVPYRVDITIGIPHMLEKVSSIKLNDQDLLKVSVCEGWVDRSCKTRKYVLACLRNLIDAEMQLTDSKPAPKKTKFFKFPKLVPSK